MSLNQWIAVAVAEKVGVVETAAEFFKKRAGKATGEELMKFLRTVPKVAPEPRRALTKIRSERGCAQTFLRPILRNNPRPQRFRSIHTP